MLNINLSQDKPCIYLTDEQADTVEQIIELCRCTEQSHNINIFILDFLIKQEKGISSDNYINYVKKRLGLNAD